MTMSLVTAADSGATLPLAGILCPDAGEEIKAEHIRTPVADFLAECDDIRNGTGGLSDKVDRAGDDAITGRLTITPSGATNGLIVYAGAASGQSAVIANGNGIGVGIVGNGGTNAAGASFTAGGGNNFGARGIGNGTESGLDGTGGSTGPGFRGRPGAAATTTAPTFAYVAVDGGMHFDGVSSPNANVDPGVNFVQFPQGMTTSSAILESDGVGGFTVRGNKGVNVLSWAGDAVGVVTVNFKRNLPGVDYRISILGETGYEWGWNGVQNVGNYQFILKNSTTKATINLLTTVVALHVSTIGF